MQNPILYTTCYMFTCKDNVCMCGDMIQYTHTCTFLPLSANTLISNKYIHVLFTELPQELSW